MQADYQNVVSEKDKNAETVKRKTQEIEELHRDIEAL